MLMARHIFDSFVIASLYRKQKYSSDEQQVVGFSWECGHGGQPFEAKEKRKSKNNKQNQWSRRRQTPDFSALRKLIDEISCHANFGKVKLWQCNKVRTAAKTQTNSRFSEW